VCLRRRAKVDCRIAFPSGGIRSVVAQALGAAAGKNVLVIGADIARAMHPGGPDRRDCDSPCARVAWRWRAVLDCPGLADGIRLVADRLYQKDPSPAYFATLISFQPHHRRRARDGADACAGTGGGSPDQSARRARHRGLDGSGALPWPADRQGGHIRELHPDFAAAEHLQVRRGRVRAAAGSVTGGVLQWDKKLSAKSPSAARCRWAKRCSKPTI